MKFTNLKQRESLVMFTLYMQQNKTETRGTSKGISVLLYPIFYSHFQLILLKP